MSVLGWLLIGTVVGLAANRLLPRAFASGAVGAVVGGVLGAALGGLVVAVVANRGVGGLDLVGLAAALGGAVVLLALLWAAGQAEPRSHRKLRTR